MAFIDVSVDGFTCSMTMNTDAFVSQEEAGTSWQRALGLLAMQLVAVPLSQDSGRSASAAS